MSPMACNGAGDWRARAPAGNATTTNRIPMTNVPTHFDMIPGAEPRNAATAAVRHRLRRLQRPVWADSSGTRIDRVRQTNPIENSTGPVLVPDRDHPTRVRSSEGSNSTRIELFVFKEIKCGVRRRLSGAPIAYLPELVSTANGPGCSSRSRSYVGWSVQSTLFP